MRICQGIRLDVIDDYRNLITFLTEKFILTSAESSVCNIHLQSAKIKQSTYLATRLETKHFVIAINDGRIKQRACIWFLPCPSKPFQHILLHLVSCSSLLKVWTFSLFSSVAAKHTVCFLLACCPHGRNIHIACQRSHFFTSAAVDGWPFQL